MARSTVGIYLFAALAMATSTSALNFTDEQNATVVDGVDSRFACRPSPDALSGWYAKNYKEGPFSCVTTVGTDKPGAMLNAYSGGSRGTHWKYTSNKEDPDCLENWRCYQRNGKKVVAKIEGRLTSKGDFWGKKWCALPLYKPGGVQGKQWDYCTC